MFANLLVGIPFRYKSNDFDFTFSESIVAVGTLCIFDVFRMIGGNRTLNHLCSNRTGKDTFTAKNALKAIAQLTSGHIFQDITTGPSAKRAEQVILVIGNR